jgi:hypothetical protein
MINAHAAMLGRAGASPFRHGSEVPAAFGRPEPAP